MKKEEVREDFRTRIKWNCSSLFLIQPIVMRSMAFLHENYGLIDSYMKDKNRLDEDNMLYILFKPKDMDALQIFIAVQDETNKNFITDYDYQGGYVVLQYNIPEVYRHDVELFKQGRYSKMSPHIKHQYDFTMKVEGQSVKSFQYEVFYKDATLKEELEQLCGVTLSHTDELWAIPDKVRETLDIDKIKEDERIAESSSEIGGTSEVSRRFRFYGC